MTPVLHAQLQVTRAADGRLEGSLAPADGGDRVGFSGTLELLRALEDLVGVEPPDAPGAGGPKIAGP